MALTQSAYALPPPGSSKSGIVAFAGGGQANATPLTSDNNIVGTVATAADSVKLPAAVFGTSILVLNDTANSMNVFPQSGEAINAGAADAAIAQATKIGALYTCMKTGLWTRFLQG